MSASAIEIDVHVAASELVSAFRDDVRRGLSATPKQLQPKWFYDDRGSELFDEITRLDEYYPTRREREILRAHAAEIAAAAPGTLVELGSGTSDKTRILLDAMAEAGTLKQFVGFDVSETTLRDAASAIAAEYPGVHVAGVVGDFERHLDRIPADAERMIAFLGGTIGNLDPARRASFLAGLAATLREGEMLLLGADLVKDARRLVDAYDDASGVTAAFNLNVLERINRELEGTFDVSRFRHVAAWDSHNEWVEMRVRSLADQVVEVGALGLQATFADGEEMRTEISAKFRRERLTGEMGAAGFDCLHWWTDAAGDFSLSLWRRGRSGGSHSQSG